MRKRQVKKNQTPKMSKKEFAKMKSHFMRAGDQNGKI
jgi:hypothetical protein